MGQGIHRWALDIWTQDDPSLAEQIYLSKFKILDLQRRLNLKKEMNLKKRVLIEKNCSKITAWIKLKSYETANTFKSTW